MIRYSKAITFFLCGFLSGSGVTFFLGSGFSGPSPVKGNKADPPVTVSEEKFSSIDQFDLGENLEIDNPRLSFRQLRRVAEKRVLIDPAKAVTDALLIPGHDNREAYFSEALGTWGELDGETAASWCSGNFEGELLSDALYYVSEGWAETDPEGAARWFYENTDTTTREDTLWEVLESWGRKDPEKAFAWAEELEPDLQSAVMDAVAEGWAAIDPERAAEIGASMEGRPYQYEFLSAVASNWSDSDPGGSAEWASGILHEGMRNGVFVEIGENWSSTKPGEAARWAGQMEPGGNRHSLMNGIATGWSEHDPDGAMEWVLGIDTDEEHRAEMVGDVIYNWSSIDPRGTVEWLETQDAGQKKDSVLSVFSDVVMNIDSEAAVAWANKMSDPVERESKLRSLLALWVKKEGALALRTMEQMDLPAGLKQEFLEP